MYAKSHPVETIQQHTDQLLANLQFFRETYPDLLTTAQWKILEIAVQYHDIGKVYTVFQNVIREVLKLPLLQCEIDYHIPHNYISPLFVPLKELSAENGWNRSQEKILIQTIAYHHDRRQELRDSKDVIREVIEKDLQPRIEEIAQQFSHPIQKKLGTLQLRLANQPINYLDDEYFEYVLIKGLLLRLDHAASAHEKVELHSTYHIGEYTYCFLQGNLRPLQEFTMDNQDKSIVLTAQTGMGKTEAALLWLGKEKGFFTLPLRVSMNALYQRVAEPSKIQFVDREQQPIAGLLHSTAVDFLLNMDQDQEKNEQNMDTVEQIFRQSQLLSRKLTFSTIDQLLTFPFHFKGHEKWLSTFAYSKLIIDEIQAYSPKIVAVLLKAIEQIHQMGGKFLIMTATLPAFFLEKMNEIGLLEGETYTRQTFTNQLVRHRMTMKDQRILDDLPLMIEKSKHQKVLVICNTVGQSIKVYEALADEGTSVYLLHSQFTPKDRSLLEKKITSFAPNQVVRDPEVGIWVTTQIVEASIDVDFDVLFTELSVLDSLFQRMGRCYRGRPYTNKEANIYVYSEEVSGIGRKAVYDPDLFALSKEALIPYQNEYLPEATKVALVETMYRTENLKNTSYLREFEEAWKVLQYPSANELSRNEAQKLLRDISTMPVIPRSIYDQLLPLFEQDQELRCQVRECAKNEHSQRKELQKKRKEIRWQIEQETVHIPFYKLKGKGTPIPLSGYDYIYVYNANYEFDPQTLTGRGVLHDEYDNFL
ncbi:CRISPR-associated helicase Cas3' [Hazenella coriacea]|uniref:CRISPR-associated endonuclease/helicase Cas3 n=1 Tax=Hazenella coriacea TaxID=1179467 RepID=A0A4R3L3T8_9BACL|nr:CRISPR-associated helicase Cas3' [Hazenella coriacea]TCS93598.1 CRISPR-associated endonuclease/helicase Cas3 [Hazenella coriacea]